MSAGRLRVALAGNPNVGKTTIFNLLTGMRQKVANFPGVTVERKSGMLTGSRDVEVVDLPGSYSLHAKSLDEKIAYDVLTGRLERAPDVVVCVVDASNLERNLFMVTQIMDLQLPVIVALNMMDAAEEAGITVNAAVLADELRVPVLPMVARRKEGVEELRDAVLESSVGAPRPSWELMDAVAKKVPQLEEALGREADTVPANHRYVEVLRALTDDAALEAWRAAAPEFSADVEAVRIDLEARNVHYQHAEVMGRYQWITPLAARACERNPPELSFTDRVDAVLTHRVAGPITFGLLLGLIFQAVFAWAVPAMDAIEAVMAGLGAVATQVLPGSMVTDLLVDGVIAGIGNVAVFLPQILLLFFFLGLMEDTGYMARTAFLMDRVMKRVGLSGGSVLPLLASYACAIPGIMAARTLDSERDRIITIMVAPLMSCSARLPVYTLFIGAFIPQERLLGLFGYQGLAMFTLYLMGTAMAVVASWILKRFVFKGKASYFVMELPPYRRPQLRQILLRMLQRAKVFATRAGKIIFGLSIVLWFMATYPRVEADQEWMLERQELILQRDAARARVDEGSVEELVELIVAGDSARVYAVAQSDPERHRAAELSYAVSELDRQDHSRRIRSSLIGLMGRALEPVMQPLGFDWKMSAGIVAAFAAREVIVSTLGIIYSVGEVDERSVALREQLKADRYPDGRPVFTTLAAISLLVFFVFALQCMSTLAIAKRELNSWFWPCVMWAYMTGLAYVFSLAVYQGGLLLGFQ